MKPGDCLDAQTVQSDPSRYIFLTGWRCEVQACQHRHGITPENLPQIDQRFYTRPRGR